MSRGARWSVLGVGAVFGFLLTVSGLGDYDTIHDGLLLENPYIFLMMGSAMAVAFAGLAVLRRLGRTRFAGPLALPHARVERRHVYGGAVFGLGFGLVGAYALVLAGMARNWRAVAEAWFLTCCASSATTRDQSAAPASSVASRRMVP